MMDRETRDKFVASGSTEHETPDDLYRTLDDEFDFGLDICASYKNAKCLPYIDKKQDCLRMDWSKIKRGSKSGVIWMNPPYNRKTRTQPGQIDFVEKARFESFDGNVTVALLPVRTDTKLFHRYIWNKKHHKPQNGVEVRFIEGRVKFVGMNQGALFPSMIVIFRQPDLFKKDGVEL